MKRVIITVGPSIFKDISLEEIHRENYIYRVNGAHGSPDEIEASILRIRERLPQAETMIDLPGNKVRTANLDQPLPVTVDGSFSLSRSQVNYSDFYRHVKPGDTVLASDSTLTFTVEKAAEDRIDFVSHSEGMLANNKGLHIRGIHRDIPFLFQKDKDLIDLVNKRKIDYIGLSFVRTVDDIAAAKSLIGSGIEVVSKVETRAAVENLNDILGMVDYILVDRGDLSTDIGLEKVPAYQKFIIEKANFYNKKVFLSTQFLKNMEDKPVPSIAEIIDLYNTFKMGVYGIQLSEETSIGKYPRECLDIIEKIQQEIDSEIR